MIGFPELFMLFVFVLVPWGLAAVHRSQLQHQRFMKVLQHKADFNARLLDRAASEPVALELLRDEAQRQIFDVRLSEPGQPAPLTRALTLVQAGLILLSAGGGFLMIGRWERLPGGDRFVLLGTLGVSLGVGALLAAGATLAAARWWRRMTDEG